MNSLPQRPADSWSPLYFLASLGAGGLAVTFFMFLMFWVPHPGRPVPVFEGILGAFQGGSLPLKVAILVAAIGIAVFALVNIRLLIWNLAQLSTFHRTEAHARLMTSNGETQLLAMLLAMVAVGMSAPAAMSTPPLTVGLSMILSVTLGTLPG